MMIFRMKRQMHISFECFIELQGKTKYDEENWLQIPLGFVRETDFVFGIMFAIRSKTNAESLLSAQVSTLFLKS